MLVFNTAGSTTRAPHLVANIDPLPPRGGYRRIRLVLRAPRRPRFAVTKKGFVITVFRSEILANNVSLRHVDLSRLVSVRLAGVGGLA
jgi:hypothetical protein